MKFVILAVAVLATAFSDDSLQEALKGIHRKQREISKATDYYGRPYLFGDGQPEDIGYGYQKAISPNSGGLFEPLPIPFGDLGTHDFPDRVTNLRAIQNYLIDNEDERSPDNLFPNVLPDMGKRSVFREREDPGMYYEVKETSNRGDEKGPIFIPSSFRERLIGNEKTQTQNPFLLLKNFEGVRRDVEGNHYNYPLDDNEEYLNVLNSIWEKYKEEEEDPEELSDSEVEGILEYLNDNKGEIKRQGPYDNSYEMYKYPMGWTKRSHQRNGLESYKDLLGLGEMEDQRAYYRKKTYPEAGFDNRYQHGKVQKKYLITKRSPSRYEDFDPRSHKESIKGKKTTDPKVAEVLNNIFSNHKNNTIANSSEPASTTFSPEVAHKGQKEESSDTMSYRPLQVKKKSINLSNYFGIDRRRKKSLGGNVGDDEWFVNQYLEHYGMNKFKRPDVGEPNHSDKQRPDDMDNKLRAMEDLIVDQAIKYTGAHEGTSDPKEVHDVKDKVISQLAAAYSLEKMRRALGEFKSSIAAQKGTVPGITEKPSTVAPVLKKEKRIPFNKEKTRPIEKVEKKAKSNEIINAAKEAENEMRGGDTMECPILQGIEMRCKQVTMLAGDRSEVFLPLCNLHEICYLCGSQIGASSPRECDLTFLSEAHAVCRDDLACYYSARKTLLILRSFKDEGLQTCDWQTHPCLARFLAIAMKRRR